MHGRNERGAIMVETALVSSLIFTFVLGVIQIGVVGFLQQTADTAAFLYARGNVVAVNNPSGPAAAVHSVFPQIKTSEMSGNAVAASQPSIGTDFLYNGTPAEIANSANNRHGGVATLQAENFRSTVLKSNVFNFLGFNLSVYSQSVEPYWRECGAHFDVANSTAACGAASQPTNYNIDILTQGENTPPYFVTFAYSPHCVDRVPWPLKTCQKNEFLDYGLAEYLDAKNISTTNPDCPGCGGNWQIATNGATANPNGQTFSPMVCHQRMYAYLSRFLNYYSDLGLLYADYYNPGPDIVTLPYRDNVNVGTHGGMYRYWSVYGVVGANPGTAGYGSLFDSETNAAIDAIYTWNATVAAGYPPASYTGPGNAQLNSRNYCNIQQSITF